MPTNDELLEQLTDALTKLKGNLAAATEEVSTSKLLDTAEKSFTGVLESKNHYQDMASRILGAVAFLTAAAVAVYVKASSLVVSSGYLETAINKALAAGGVESRLAPMIVQNLSGTLQSVYPPILNWPLIAFFSYMLSILVGAVMYMATLWPPYFEIQDDTAGGTAAPRSGSNALAKLRTHSFLAFGSLKTIKGLSDLKTRYALHEMNKFEEELLDTYLIERSEIADHANRVAHYLFIGTHFFVIAFFCFIGLAATLFLPNERHALRACLIGFVVFAFFLGVGNYLRSKHWSRRMMIVWGIVTIGSLIGLALSWIL
jgi:hypothetical protein